MNFLEERLMERKKADDVARETAKALSKELRTISEQITAFFEKRSNQMIMADMEDIRTIVVEANSSEIAKITGKASGRYEAWFTTKSGIREMATNLTISDLADVLIDNVPR